MAKSNKYNIFKIRNDARDELEKALKERKLKEQKRIEGDINYTLYLSSKPKPKEIIWLRKYNRFIEKQPKNTSNYFGVLLIWSAEWIYAVSEGAAHFTIKPFCDLGFGIDLAERILVQGNTTTQQSKFQKSKKKSAIVNFYANHGFDFEPGESTHFLKGKTNDPEVWGASASFGNSVKFSIKHKPEELGSFCEQLEETLKLETVISIPRLHKVVDQKKMTGFDEKLIHALKEKSGEIEMTMPLLTGVEFNFEEDWDFEIQCKFKKKKTDKRQTVVKEEIVGLEVKHVADFILKQKTKKLDAFFISCSADDRKTFEKSLKYFLDFQIENYCLIDGEWWEFNQNYINTINDKVDSIQIDRDEKFDIIPEFAQRIKQFQPKPKKLKKGEKKKGKPRNERESNFNNLMAAEYGYENLDKKMKSIDGHAWERTDLYKDNAYYFVKIGEPKELGYVVDQALQTVDFLRSTDVDKTHDDVNKLVLWLIFNRKTDINELSEIKSIIFKTKLANWIRIARDANYATEIKLNYLRE